MKRWVAGALAAAVLAYSIPERRPAEATEPGPKEVHVNVVVKTPVKGKSQSGGKAALGIYRGLKEIPVVLNKLFLDGKKVRFTITHQDKVTNGKGVAAIHFAVIPPRGVSVPTMRKLPLMAEVCADLSKVGGPKGRLSCTPTQVRCGVLGTVDFVVPDLSGGD